MYHQDYLLRMIQQFIIFLAHLVGLKERGDPEVVRLQIDGAWRLYTGMEGDLILRLGTHGVQQLFSAGGELDYQRLFLTAILLVEESENREQLGFHEIACRAASMSIEFFQLCSDKEIAERGLIAEELAKQGEESRHRAEEIYSRLCSRTT